MFVTMQIYLKKYTEKTEKTFHSRIRKYEEFNLYAFNKQSILFTKPT